MEMLEALRQKLKSKTTVLYKKGLEIRYERWFLIDRSSRGIIF
jgi:hypothetical protein